MGFRTYLLCLGWLAAPLAAETTPPITTGTAAWIHSPASELEVTVQREAEEQCIAGFGSRPTSFPTLVPVRCLAVINGEETPNPSFLLAKADFRNPVIDGGNVIHENFELTSWELTGQPPLVTSCGIVRYWVSFVPSPPQPISSLTLWPDASGAPSGLFAGTLRIAARLYLENLSQPLVADLPMTFELAVEGQWSATPTGAPAPSETSSGQVILISREALQALDPKLGCGGIDFGQTPAVVHCDVCPGQSPSVLPPPEPYGPLLSH